MDQQLQKWFSKRKHWDMYAVSGTGGVSKTDEFFEKLQTAFDPPLHFRKIKLQIIHSISCSKIYNKS